MTTAVFTRVNLWLYCLFISCFCHAYTFCWCSSHKVARVTSLDKAYLIHGSSAPPCSGLRAPMMMWPVGDLHCADVAYGLITYQSWSFDVFLNDVLTSVTTCTASSWTVELRKGITVWCLWLSFRVVFGRCLCSWTRWDHVCVRVCVYARCTAVSRSICLAGSLMKTRMRGNAPLDSQPPVAAT